MERDLGEQLLVRERVFVNMLVLVYGSDSRVTWYSGSIACCNTLCYAHNQILTAAPTSGFEHMACLVSGSIT